MLVYQYSVKSTFQFMMIWMICSYLKSYEVSNNGSHFPLNELNVEWNVFLPPNQEDFSVLHNPQIYNAISI